MNDPIQCRYQWTLDCYIMAHDQHRRHSPKARQLTVIVWIIALVSIATAIVRLINQGFNSVSVALLILGSAIVSSRWYGRRLLARTFAKLPDRDTEIRWQINPDQFVVETSTSKTEIAWSRVMQITRTEQGFLIYPQPGLVYWLPLSSFSDPSDVQRFEQLMESRGAAGSGPFATGTF